MKMVKNWINKIGPLLAMLLLLASCEETPTGDFSNIEGYYTCNESSAHSGFRKYIIEIDGVVNQDNNYIIANFHNLGDNEFLFAAYENDTLYVRNQVIGTIFINGKGKVFNEFNRIEMEYTTDDGVTILDYYAVYER